MKELLFYIVILLANIIQGITGFAGTILAMPFSLILVGYDVAKPVLNVLGLLSGVYVFLGNRKHVCIKEVQKIVAIMTVGVLTGMIVKRYLRGSEQILYYMLGIFVVCLGVHGLLTMRQEGKDGKNKKGNLLLLVGAGIAHGIFVSGGPLLIGYLTKKITKKEEFRATISTVWILLNTIILVSDIVDGLWTPKLLQTQLFSIPFLLVGMFIGSKLYKHMSQKLFMGLTYLLLLLSGVTLLLK